MSDTRESESESGSATNPFLSGSTGIEVVDPATATSGNGDSAAAATGTDSSGSAEPVITPKRRGRKPGSKNATTKKAAAIDLGGLDSILFSIHLALSAITKMPELALDEAESKKLAEAASAVQAQYDVTLNPKMLAWSQLVIVAGAIYGPRAIAVSMRVKREKASKRASTVVSADFGNHATTR